MPEQTTLYSQGFSFGSFIQGGVDPRTGQYTCSITLYEAPAQSRNIPPINLCLTYNALKAEDVGFGRGWSFNLSHYQPGTRGNLYLSTGEQYKVSEFGGQPNVDEQKLKSFWFKKTDSGYRVIHKSGLIEVLSDDHGFYDSCVLHELHASNGRSLTFQWTDSRHPQLASIKDGSETLLQIDYSGDQVKVTQTCNSPQRSVSVFNLQDGLLREFQLPEENTRPQTFDYGIFNQVTCLICVTSPGGRVEVVDYRGNDDGHKLPQGAPSTLPPTIPNVKSHILKPDEQQPPISTSYSYSEKNFLGYGLEWDDTQDILLHSHVDYEYLSTTKVKDGPETVNTYNKYHLLRRSVKTQERKQVTQEFDYYEGDFEQQPAYYQLPRTIRTTYRDLHTGDQLIETSYYKFDDWGNPTQVIEKTGVRIDRTYYSADGETDPATGEVYLADPHGFTQHLKQETTTPTESPYTTPTRTKCYAYDSLPTAAGALVDHFKVVRQVKSLENEELVSSIDYIYYTDQDPQLNYGRVKQQTDSYFGQQPPTKVTNWDYQYSPTGMLVETIQTRSSDSYQVQEQTSYSLYSGLALMHEDQANVQTDSEYDALNRLVKVTTSPGTSYEATRSYQYNALQHPGGYTLTVIDCKGVQVRYTVDGLNRVRRIEKQDDDGEKSEGDVDSGKMLLIEERSYNSLGQCIEVVNIDWLADNDGVTEQRYIQSYEYDDWGQLCKTTESNGVVTLSDNDPISQTQKEEITGHSKRQNRFDSRATVTKSLLTATGVSYSTLEYTCDGQGRIIQEKDDLGSITQYQYDPFERVTQTTWPDNRVGKAEYTNQSGAVLPTSIRINDTILGQQSFDGGGRRTMSNIGGRITTQSFDESTPKPSTITTPRGARSFKYDAVLGYALTEVREGDGGEIETYAYDLQTADILQSTNSFVSETLKYTPSRRLLSESFQFGEQALLSTKYTYSVGGRLQAYTDVHKENHTFKYDGVGRLHQLLQGNVKVSLTYDEVDRLSETCVTDLEKNASLTTCLEYDDFARETRRTVQQGKVQLFELGQEYDNKSRLTKRELKNTDSKIFRRETFEYDVVSRLSCYQCEGSAAPVDECGRQLKDQRFSFTEYNGLHEVATTFQDGSKNITRYFYNSEDPTQVVQITNTHPSSPAEVHLEYDANGCLIKDEQGRRMEYDIMSRLTTVRDADNEHKILSQYHYDTDGKLVCQVVSEKPIYLHYRGDTLIASSTEDSKVSYLSDGEVCWGQTTTTTTVQGGQTKTELWAADGHQSTLAWLDTQNPNVVHHQQYTPYGFSNGSCSIGFNGQRRDPITGWYHLGNGYRVYNPVLMRFHTPDPVSPFGSGEINPYTYCLGDPVNRVDPSGRFSIFGWEISGRDLALAIVGVAVSVLAGILTGGASVAVEVGVGVAAGVASDVATGALYDVASGKTPTWKSVGTDAFYGAIGGIGGEAIGRGIASGAKAVSRAAKNFRSGLDQLLEGAEKIRVAGKSRRLPKEPLPPKAVRGKIKTVEPREARAPADAEVQGAGGAAGGAEVESAERWTLIQPKKSKMRLNPNGPARERYERICYMIETEQKSPEEVAGLLGGLDYHKRGGNENEIFTFDLPEGRGNRMGFTQRDHVVTVLWAGGHDLHKLLVSLSSPQGH